MKKVAMVTGASSGIGESTVRQLLADGYTVFAGARRLERMRELEQAGAVLQPLDLTDDASMVAAIEAIRQGPGRLDVLVNNAGYGSYGALEDVPMSEARRQCEVNLFGLARLIQLATPLMRAQRAGAIVNITSIGGKMHEPMGCWYHATKFAVEGLSDCLRMELAPFGIHVIVIEPGAIRTEWGGIARDSLLRYSGDTVYAEQARRHARLFESADTSNMVSPPAVVAATIASALRARRPRTRYATGGGAAFILAIRRFTTDRGFDWFMRMIERRMTASSP